MANILFTSLPYPLHMGRWFRFAFEKLGNKVYFAAPWGERFKTIPWNTSVNYERYWDVPDLQLDDNPDGYESAHYVVNMARLDGFEPDFIFSSDAGFALTDANLTGIPNAIWLSDPHALPDRYKVSVDHYSTVFCAQDYLRKDYGYRADGSSRAVWWTPYGFSPEYHYWTGTDFTNRPYDVGIISALIYPERAEALAAMEDAGIQLFQSSGILYHEYAPACSQFVMGFNRSGYGKQDLPARFWEALACRNLAFTNRLPDLKELSELKEDVHYVAYDTVDELLDKATYYAKHRDVAWKIASAGYAQVWSSDHSYYQRARLILDVCDVGKE